MKKLLCFCVSLMCLLQFTAVQAEEVVNTDITVSEDTITFTFSGILQNQWWWYQKDLVAYDSTGSKQTIQVQLSPANNTGSMQLNWEDLPVVMTYTQKDDTSHAFTLTAVMDSDALKNFTSIEIDGQIFRLENTASPSPEPTSSTEPSVSDGSTGPFVDGKIIVDGKKEDWTCVSELISNDPNIESWKVAKDIEGNLYVEFSGTAVSEWDSNYLWKCICINEKQIQINSIENKAYNNEAHGNTPGPYCMEFMIPADALSQDYSVTFACNEILSSTIPVLNGIDVTPTAPSEYEGIVIDGRFDDWNGVQKYPATCPNYAHNCLESTSMVFDGEYVYIYVKDGPVGDASVAGSHSNGKWEITTDLGRHLVLTLNSDGTISSEATGIDSIHVGSQWEIAIPASQLPNYKKTINWGLYSVGEGSLEPFVKDVANLNGTNGTAGEKSQITIDGQYGDWANYPYTYYEYATNGTQENKIDSHTAITTDDKTLYQYVSTNMSAHLLEAGGEFSQAITIRLNDDESKSFYPRLVAVDAQGNINWNPQLSGLAPGTYTFELVDTQGWSNAATLADLKTHGNEDYGTMIMTIGENQIDSCEYSLDLEKVAQKFNMKAEDIQIVASQFGRIGQQWAKTSGASSGPLLGILLCLLTVAGTFLYRKGRLDWR